MKYLILFLMSILSRDLYSQLEFAPIGAKWIYETASYAFTGEKSNSITIFESIQDTVVNQKKCRLLKRYEIVKGKIGNPNMTYFYKPAIILQDKYKIFHLIQDSLYLLYDWSLKSGDSIELQGERFPTEGLVPGYSTKIKSNIIDTSFRFSVRKIEQDMFCGGRLGSWVNIIQFEKFGMTENCLFYMGEFCGIDYNITYHLRCYQDDQVGLIKFDSIPCDSIRTEVHEIAEEPKLIIYPTIVSNQLNLFFDENYINYSQIFSMNGTLMLNPINSINNNKSAIDVSYLIPGIYILKTKLKHGNILVNKFIKME